MPATTIVSELAASSIHVNLHIDGLTVNVSLCNHDALVALKLVFRIIVVSVEHIVQSDSSGTVSQTYLVVSKDSCQRHVGLRRNLSAYCISLSAVVPAGQRGTFLIERVVLRSRNLIASLNFNSSRSNTSTLTCSEGNIVDRYLFGQIGGVNSLNSKIGVIVGIAKVQRSGFIGAIVCHNDVVVIARPLGTYSIELGHLLASGIGDNDIVAKVVSSVRDLHAALNGNASCEVAPAVSRTVPVTLQRGGSVLSIVGLTDSAVFSHGDVHIAPRCQSLQLRQVGLDVAEVVNIGYHIARL